MTIALGADAPHTLSTTQGLYRWGASVLAIFWTTLFFCLAFGFGSASAATYVPGTPATFCSGPGPAAGQCEELKGVAVDQSNGNVYVIDANAVAGAGNFRISQYTSSGTFVRGFGVGVADGTTLAPQVCTTTCFAGKETGAAGAVGTGARGIAVDPTTHIVYFVAGAAKVAYYDGTTGAFLGEFVAAGSPGTGQVVANPPAPQVFSGTTGIAVDTSGSQHYLYVATGNGTVNPYVIDKFKVPVPSTSTPPAYVCQITGKETASSSECHGTASKDGAFDGLSFNGQSGATLAVDASGNVYAAEGASRNVVSMFDSSGGFVKAISATAPTAVASGSPGKIFVADRGTAAGGEKVEEFDVATGTATSEISLATATSLGVAVDTSGLSSNGNVYAAEKGGKQLRKFTIASANSLLKVIKAGTGTGTVTSDKAGTNAKTINCGSDCEETFTNGEVVTLTAAAGANSGFTGWSGGGCTGTGTCVVTMSAAKEVTATFDLEQHLLTVSKSGAGSGEVTSAPAGIACGATCSASFNHGTVVTLSQLADPGSKFKEWTGACSGSGTCEVTMTAAKSVTAVFIEKFTLSVSKSGSGGGTVTSTPAGVNCGSTCSAEFDEGTVVTLNHSQDSSSEFKEWTGACSGSGTCEVTMSAAKSVGAKFDLIPGQKTFTPSTSGTGTGQIKCNGGPCAATYAEGAVVTLEAIPQAGSSFTSWTLSGQQSTTCTGTTSPCTVTFGSSNVTADAQFTSLQRTLTITKAGTGDGTIQCEINSSGTPGACAASYADGTVVKVIATADGNSTFAGFSGGTGSASSCSTSPCTFTITANSSLTATFNSSSRTLNVVKVGSGDGTIQCEINSSGTPGACAASYADGTNVKVIATANGSSTFGGFSGGTGSASSCSTSPCSFTITANSSLTATFNLAQRTLAVNKAGTGNGSFECKVNAGAFGPCASSYTDGQTIVVKAFPNASSTFVSWAGCSSTAGSECTISAINANKAVTATFNLASRTLAINKGGTGDGSFECKVNAGSFGACAASYTHGDAIVVKALPNSGSSFTSWAGCSSTAGSECTISAINADTTLTATFTANPVSPPADPEKNCGNTPSLCPPPSNVITLGTAKAKGQNVLLKVTVPGPGTLVATGKNLVKANGTAKAAGTTTLKLKLTSAGKKALKKKGKLKVKVKIAFTPTGGTVGTATKTVTFKKGR